MNTQTYVYICMFMIDFRYYLGHSTVLPKQESRKDCVIPNTKE